MSSPYCTFPKYGGSVNTASRLFAGRSSFVALAHRIDTQRAAAPLDRSPIHSPLIGTKTFRPSRDWISNGRSQYFFAVSYLVMMFDQPPEPTFEPFPLLIPNRLDSHWIN